jgi:hypothetical protein
MPLGMIILLVTAVLIFLGLGQRVLDRLRLTDKAALLFIGAMLIGGFLPDIPITRNVAINIGGGVIPLVLVVYLLAKAGTVKERTRAIIAALVTGGVVYAATKVLPTEPTYYLLLDPIYVFALIAGIIGYLAGRSRRSAFIAGVGGLVLVDIFSRIELFIRGVAGTGSMVIGGAGIFDGVVLAGFISLGLAEVIGEVRERAQGGPSHDRPEELLKGLSDEEIGSIDDPHRHEGEEHGDGHKTEEEGHDHDHH